VIIARWSDALARTTVLLRMLISTGKKTTSVYLSAMPADGTRAAR
jgi:hypothetical protein